MIADLYATGLEDAACNIAYALLRNYHEEGGDLIEKLGREQQAPGSIINSSICADRLGLLSADAIMTLASFGLAKVDVRRLAEDAIVDSECEAGIYEAYDCLAPYRANAGVEVHPTKVSEA